MDVNLSMRSLGGRFRTQKELSDLSLGQFSAILVTFFFGDGEKSDPKSKVGMVTSNVWG